MTTYLHPACKLCLEHLAPVALGMLTSLKWSCARYRDKSKTDVDIFFGGRFLFIALLLLGLERGDKLKEAILSLGSTPIIAMAVVYLSIWIYAGCVMLKICPSVQALGWR